MKEIFGFCQTISDTENPFLVTGRSAEQKSLRQLKLVQLLEGLSLIDCLADVDTDTLGNAMEAVLVVLPDMHERHEMSKYDGAEIAEDDNESAQDYFQILKLVTTTPPSVRTKTAMAERDAEKREFNGFVQNRIPHFVKQRRDAKKALAQKSFEGAKEATLKLRTEAAVIKATTSVRLP